MIKCRLAALILSCALLSGCGVRTDWPPILERKFPELFSETDSSVGLSQEEPVIEVPPQEDPPVEVPPESEPPQDVEVFQPEPEILPYDYTQPAPQTDPVEDSYFGDAAFVGDSRTDGLMIYGGVKGPANLTSNGLSIFQVGEKKALKVGEEKVTLLEALSLKEYGKVYLSLGVNELGYHDNEGFYQAYCETIEAIRDLQPQAVIYIQGLIPLNEQVIRKTGGPDYLKNDKLRIYNDLMRQAAQEKQVVYLDLYSHFVQEDGELPAEASRDGVHLVRDYCRQWMDYLRCHTVDPRALTRDELEGEKELA